MGEVTKTNTKQCVCPHCVSQCNKRFRICDFQSISLRLIARKKLQSVVEGTVTGEQETSRFLNTIMATAISGTSTVLRGGGREHGQQQDAGDVLATNAASATVRLGISFSLKGLEALQKGVGRDTVVTLPGGQRFNTRLIGDDGKHGKNNRLPGQGGNNDTTVIAPGMVSRLCPNFENVTADFAEAAKKGPSSAALMLQSALVDLTKTTAAMVDLTKSASDAETGEEEEVEMLVS